MLDNIESLTRVLRIIALSLYIVVSCVLYIIPNNPVKVGFQILASILYFSYQAVGERIIIRSLRSLTKWNIKTIVRRIEKSFSLRFFLQYTRFLYSANNQQIRRRILMPISISVNGLTRRDLSQDNS